MSKLFKLDDMAAKKTKVIRPGTKIAHFLGVKTWETVKKWVDDPEDPVGAVIWYDDERRMWWAWDGDLIDAMNTKRCAERALVASLAAACVRAGVRDPAEVERLLSERRGS